MSFLKILFGDKTTSVREMEKAPLEIKVEVPEKSEAKIFDEAVKKVSIEKLEQLFYWELINTALGEEGIEHNRKVKEANKLLIVDEMPVLDVKKMYPDLDWKFGEPRLRQAGLKVLANKLAKTYMEEKEIV